MISRFRISPPGRTVRNDSSVINDQSCLGATSLRFAESQRHRLSLVNLVPPHQREIGLCRLKSSVRAKTALPSAVSDQPAFLISLVTAAVIVHILGERPFAEARYGRYRTTRQTIQQRSGFPIAEYSPLVWVMRKELERMYVTFRYKLEHPHFRRAKSGCAPGKFFKQFYDSLPKPRQDGQIL